MACTSPNQNMVIAIVNKSPPSPNHRPTQLDCVHIQYSKPLFSALLSGQLLKLAMELLLQSETTNTYLKYRDTLCSQPHITVFLENRVTRTHGIPWSPVVCIDMNKPNDRIFTHQYSYFSFLTFFYKGSYRTEVYALKSKQNIYR